jgi:hypothetical protein
MKYYSINAVKSQENLITFGGLICEIRANFEENCHKLKYEQSDLRHPAIFDNYMKLTLIIVTTLQMETLLYFFCASYEHTNN